MKKKKLTFYEATSGIHTDRLPEVAVWREDSLPDQALRAVRECVARGGVS